MTAAEYGAYLASLRGPVTDAQAEQAARILAAGPTDGAR